MNKLYAIHVIIFVKNIENQLILIFFNNLKKIRSVNKNTLMSICYFINKLYAIHVIMFVQNIEKINLF